ncbi:hypothetical protein ACFE04_002279 [Oxalis oulophora]
MAIAFKSLPIIDISPMLAKIDDPNAEEDSGVCEVVKQLDQACREAGFFYIKGHGIDEFLVKEVRNLSRKFFHLPLEEKLKIKLTPDAAYRGYQPFGLNLTNGELDRHEAIDALALGLGGSKDLFERHVAGNPFWVVRVMHYPGLSSANGHDRQENDIGCGAHTDYGLLALVNQDDDVTALQVRNLSGEWISAPPIPGTFVCNIGDMLKILTNGLYESTMHRVINNSPKDRVSIPYFYETNFDVPVEPLDVCIQKSGGTRKYDGAVVYGEHLIGKLKKTFVETNFI